DNADVTLVIDRVQAFDEARRGDLWSGLGIACCYAGNTGKDELLRLLTAAGRFAPHFRLGVMGGAQARIAAGHPPHPPHPPCRTLTGRAPVEAATLAATVERDVLADRAIAPGSLHELFRERIIAHFAGQEPRQERAELRPN